MDSWPPATTTVASPLRIIRAASITAVRPDRQTLLMVTVGTFQPMPAPMALWRAGFWPAPACRTWPMITESTCSALTPLAARAALMAWEPSSHGREAGELPVQAALGGAGGGEDDNIIVVCRVAHGFLFRSWTIYSKVIVTPVTEPFRRGLRPPVRRPRAATGLRPNPGTGPMFAIPGEVG